MEIKFSKRGDAKEVGEVIGEEEELKKRAREKTI
jgi:hypothetical protein